jgi:hypothetical protein
MRVAVEGGIEVTPDRPTGSSAVLGIDSSILINLAGETRFLRGIEIEVTAPQAWLLYRGSLVMAAYNNLSVRTASGIVDLDGNRIAFEALPSRLQIVYQIPLRPSHGLRTTPYITVPADVTASGTFPLLFRLMPVVKGITRELETMTFNLTARPILSDEGAVRLIPRYPPQLRGRPFTVLIDDVLIDNISETQFLKEGEHHLVILSEDYRNESRRFVVEKARTLDLTIELQDPAPFIIFEGPQNAIVFLDNVQILQTREPVAVEPGTHEVRFQIGDYTVIRTLNIQRGKTYRVVLEVDLTVNEVD